MLLIEEIHSSPVKEKALPTPVAPVKIMIPPDASLDKREMLFIQQLEEKELASGGGGANRINKVVKQKGNGFTYVSTLVRKNVIDKGATKESKERPLNEKDRILSMHAEERTSDHLKLVNDTVCKTMSAVPVPVKAVALREKDRELQIKLEIEQQEEKERKLRIQAKNALEKERQLKEKEMKRAMLLEAANKLLVDDLEGPDAESSALISSGMVGRLETVPSKAQLTGAKQQKPLKTAQSKNVSFQKKAVDADKTKLLTSETPALDVQTSNQFTNILGDEPTKSLPLLIPKRSIKSGGDAEQKTHEVVLPPIRKSSPTAPQRTSSPKQMTEAVKPRSAGKSQSQSVKAQELSVATTIKSQETTTKPIKLLEPVIIDQNIVPNRKELPPVKTISQGAVEKATEVTVAPVQSDIAEKLKDIPIRSKSAVERSHVQYVEDPKVDLEEIPDQEFKVVVAKSSALQQKLHEMDEESSYFEDDNVLANYQADSVYESNLEDSFVEDILPEFDDFDNQYLEEDDGDDSAYVDQAPSFIMHEVYLPVSIPSLNVLATLPWDIIEVLVPKSYDNGLRVLVRYDDAGIDNTGLPARGLFIHGFKTNCVAEEQGLLKIGDELLEVNGVSVCGQHLFFLVTLLEEFVADDCIMLKIKRRYDVDKNGAGLSTINTQMYGSPTVTRQQLEQFKEQEELLIQDMEYLDSVDLNTAEEKETENYSLNDEDEEDEDDKLEVEPPDPMFTTTTSTSNLPIPSLFDQPTLRPNLRTVQTSSEWDDYEYIVPKSIDGTLRIIIMKADGTHSGDSDLPSGGLFIHGFKNNSAAEESNTVRIGDEIIAINNSVVQNKDLKFVAYILEKHINDEYVLIHIRRRRVAITSLKPDSAFSTSLKLHFNKAEEESDMVVHDWNEEDADQNTDDYLRSLLDYGLSAKKSGSPGKSANSRSLFNLQTPTSANLNTNSLFASKPNTSIKKSASASDSRKLTSGIDFYTATPTKAVRTATPMLRLQSPSLATLRKLPTDVFQFNIPKTNGELCLYLRHEDEGLQGHGLFIHGFKQIAMETDDEENVVSYARSLVEQQGLIKIGDELITINGVDVEGKYLEDVVGALRYHVGDVISVCVKRRNIPL